MVTCADIEKWKPDTLLTIIGAAESVHKSLEKLGENYDGTKRSLSDWGGLTAEAWKAQHGKLRTDITEQGRQAKAVADAMKPLYDEVLSVKREYDDLKSTIERNASFDRSGATVHWRLRPDGSIDSGSVPLDYQSAMVKQDLELRMQHVLIKATSVDADIANALRAITSGQIPTVGGQTPTDKPKDDPQSDDKKPDPTIAASTPADQLPLPAKGGAQAVPTEATARHDGLAKGPDYMEKNPHPSPLLAGLSAEEWRKRLANFKPGEPLPDPRTPTGDKAIDTLANAAGQQNTTYAWGGNRDTNGPSVGTLHGDLAPDYAAHNFEDNKRTGFDCGGLVRYSVAQGTGFDPQTGAGIDVGMGTNAIDTNKQLRQIGPGGLNGNAVNNSVAQAGDVLVFGGSNPFHGGDTGHTGIYIGNGYMMNAPGSGMPVRVDPVGGHGKTDILRVP